MKIFEITKFMISKMNSMIMKSKIILWTLMLLKSNVKSERPQKIYPKILSFDNKAQNETFNFHYKLWKYNSYLISGMVKKWKLHQFVIFWNMCDHTIMVLNKKGSNQKLIKANLRLWFDKNSISFSFYLFAKGDNIWLIKVT